MLKLAFNRNLSILNRNLQCLRVNKRLFTLSRTYPNQHQKLNEETNKERLADIKDNIYTWPNALCLAR